jgi:chromosome segregation ATPase
MSNDYASEIMGGALAEAVRAAVAAERSRREAAEAECARLRVELAAVRSAVRMLDGARAAIDANGQRVLRSIAGEERAALLEELAAARRERDDWNARATAMEAERDEARDAMRAAVRACARLRVDLEATERARREAAEAECDRLRVELDATERARQEAEEERDTVLELAADDVVRAARERDDRDAAWLAALATLRVALADARASHAALAALLENA